MCVCVCAHACVCACVRLCVRECMRVCVHAGVCVSLGIFRFLVSFQLYDHISMGVFCGSAQPPLITSTSNTLYIYFYSDATINGKGFQAYFSKIGKNEFHNTVNKRKTGFLTKIYEYQ